MSYKVWYTINSKGNDYICVAVDKELNFIKQYGISMEGKTAGNCDCIAGHTYCRHKKMLALFLQKNLVNTRTYYNFDREKWLKPVEMDK